MDLDKFHTAVKRVRAEQYFQEKAASAPAVSAVRAMELAFVEAATDQDLLKLAAAYNPEAPLETYAALGGQFKVAGDVVNFARPISAKARSMARQILGKATGAKGVVQNVDFSNPSGVRAGMKNRADAGARAAHNAGVMKRMKIEDEFMRTGKVPKGAHEAFGMKPPAGRDMSSPAKMLGMSTGAMALGGAAVGGVTSGLRGAMMSDKERVEGARNAGPIGRAVLKHPGLAGAVSGAISAPLALHAKTMPGAVAGAFAPVLGMGAVDAVLKHREQRQKTTP